MLGGLNESQELGDYRGIGVRLDAFPGLQVDSRNEDGAVGGLPQKGLVPAAVTGVGLEWCESTGLVTQDKDATMCACSFLVGLSWSSKSCPASNAEVLAGLLVPLWIKVSLNKDVHLTLSCSVPVQYLFAECRDVGKVYLVVCLFQSWSLVWAWVKRWFSQAPQVVGVTE